MVAPPLPSLLSSRGDGSAAQPDMTFYDELGVAPDASAVEVRRAYLDLARQWHPDSHAGADTVTRDSAARRMQRVNEAWHVLGDAARRRAYDVEIRRATPDETRRDPVDAVVDDEDDDVPPWWEETTATSGKGTRFAIAPMLLVAAAVACFSAGLVIHPALLVLSLLCLALAGVLFVVMPLFAMTSARRRERT